MIKQNTFHLFLFAIIFSAILNSSCSNESHNYTIDTGAKSIQPRDDGKIYGFYKNYQHRYSKDTLSRIPQNLYESSDHQVSEQNFKETIRKHNKVWVMYWNNDQTNLDQKRRGMNFYYDLKYHFGDQLKGPLDGFIVIDTTNWSNQALAAWEETTTKKFPSFIYYIKGVVVNEGTPKDIRILGVPRYDKYIYSMNTLKYIVDNTDLIFKK